MRKNVLSSGRYYKEVIKSDGQAQHMNIKFYSDEYTVIDISKAIITSTSLPTSGSLEDLKNPDNQSPIVFGDSTVEIMIDFQDIIKIHHIEVRHLQAGSLSYNGIKLSPDNETYVTLYDTYQSGIIMESTPIVIKTHRVFQIDERLGLILDVEDGFFDPKLMIWDNDKLLLDYFNDLLKLSQHYSMDTDSTDTMIHLVNEIGLYPDNYKDNMMINWIQLGSVSGIEEISIKIGNLPPASAVFHGGSSSMSLDGGKPYLAVYDEKTSKFLIVSGGDEDSAGSSKSSIYVYQPDSDFSNYDLASFDPDSKTFITPNVGDLENIVMVDAIVFIEGNWIRGVLSGIIEVDDMLDASGDKLIPGECYVCDKDNPRKITKIEPVSGLVQPILQVYESDGKLVGYIASAPSYIANESMDVRRVGKGLRWQGEILEAEMTDEVDTYNPSDSIIPSEIGVTRLLGKVKTIEELKRLRFLKVGDVVEVLGYYESEDGANHKRKIESSDDGSGILLNNGLWANIIHNGEVCVSWFGAKGDGVTDDSDIIQKSINYSQNKDVILRTNQNMLINNALNLDNVTLIGNGDMILCDFDISSSISINDNVVLKNIVFRSNKRILNTINITGNNNKICDIVVFNTEKASFTPQPPNYIKYNQGCIYVSGINNTIKGSEFYNNEGAGIYINGNHIEINNNYIHDNVSGIILDRASKDCFIENNKIINNNAVKTEGADGILSRCVNLIVENNIIKGSGEHGVYLQGNNTLCIGNIVEDNERCGIKFSSVNKGIISSNVVNNNTVKQGSNESQIYLQGNCSGITISQNINLTNLNNSFFIRVVDGGSVYNGEIDIIQNKGLGNIIMGGTSKLNCLHNIVDGDIIYGSYSTINIPDECYIDGNVAKVLNLYEIKNSKVINNICDNIICTKSVNLVIGNNRIKQQTSQIDVISFKTFSKNKINVNMDKALFTTIRKVDDIEIRENEFTLTKSTRGLYEPSSESISGDRWVISRNKIKGSTQAFCNYGVNHIITENFVENNSSLGYFGCSNSIVTHNQATVSFRSGVSGNISDKNIPQNTIVQLDTPAMQYAMELEGVKQDYLEYSLEKFKYDKQLEAEEKSKYEAYELLLKDNPNLTWEEFEQQYGNTSMMNLSLVERLEEPQIPESVVKFMEKYL